MLFNTITTYGIVLIRNKLLLGFLIIIAITVPNGIIGYVKMDQSISKIENELFTNLHDLENVSRLNNLAAYIKYYDEVLTQSARNYAFTGDERWRQAYFAAEPELDKIIQTAIESGGEYEKSFFQDIHDANTALVRMEHESIRLSWDGKGSDAVAVLESSEYWNQKNAYKNALENYAKSKGFEYEQILETSTASLESAIRDVSSVLVDARTLLYYGIPTVLFIVVFLCYYIFKSISNPLNRLKKTIDQVSNGDYDVEFPKDRPDEIGDLAKRLESMLKSFKSSLETELQLTMAQERLKTEKLTAIGELAARIAHDLRNPLSVIKNVCELIKIQYGSSDPKLYEHMVRMENSILRMSHQIDDVLNYVRNTTIQKKIASLRDIIMNTVADLDVPSTVTVNLPKNDEKINCDEQKIRTVILNIVLNSIQAMGENGIIDIRIKGYTKFANIEISDSGPGIPDDILPKIFEPLFTTKQAGTGLGLSSCRNIVEQHGGTIEVRNNPTTFTISLPRF